MKSKIPNEKSNVLCVVPTYNAFRTLPALIDSLKYQNADFDLLFIDSSSGDGTPVLLSNFTENIIKIPKSEFNHGGTRQLAIDNFPQYDVYIYLTQDIVLFNEDSIRLLIENLNDEGVGAVFGRQIPHVNANIFAAHARRFNYPSTSSVKAFEDRFVYGIRTAFISNSFAAYKREALIESGGFPSDLILCEDMYVCARMLMLNWRVAYESMAIVSHSHNYSIFEEFSRYFDIGVFHARQRWIKQGFGGAGGEGLRYVCSELAYIGISRFYLWPISLFRNLVKLVGFKVGFYESYIGNDYKKKLSMHKGFW
jgi:rhamnosyltransferase